MPKDFDWKFYLSAHEDLRSAGFRTKKDAINHYLTFGIQEGRPYKAQLNDKSSFSMEYDGRVEKLNSFLGRTKRRIIKEDPHERDFVIVTYDRLNQEHGTGVYLSNLTRHSKNFITLTDIEKVRTNRILSVPYYAEDAIKAIRLKNETGAALVTYIMDDQNIHAGNIPDHLMRELAEKSDFRLCISKEMSKAYSSKYGLDFHCLPPLVKASAIKRENDFSLDTWDSSVSRNNGVLLGNVWNPRWLDRFSELTRELGIDVDWYTPQKIDDDRKLELSKSGIHHRGYKSEEDLLEILRVSPYGIVLSQIDENDERWDLSLSLSSKLTYMVASANLPILSIGHGQTSNTMFVERMGVGLHSAYDAMELRDCVKDVMEYSSQERFRRNAFFIGAQLNDEYHCVFSNTKKTALEWIWRSCESGNPVNLNYENLGKTLEKPKVIVSPLEVNDLHGTGPLIKRVVGDTSDVLCLVSKLAYDFIHDFGDLTLHIDSGQTSKKGIVDRLGMDAIDKILCVPYFKEDLVTCLTLHDAFDAPMACYIMDDHNILSDGIPDALMRDFLSKCSVRFVTHPELRDAYENKYLLKFQILPQIVPDRLINRESTLTQRISKGCVIGSIWSFRWLRKLCETLKESGIECDWYGNNRYPWLQATDHEVLTALGLRPLGLLPEEELCDRLKSYPYLIVPYGTMEDDDDARHLTGLSLPGRIIFASATVGIPVIVIGSGQTPAARFVKEFGIGTSCGYDRDGLSAAIAFVKENDREIRENSMALGHRFSSKGIEQFLWNSMEWKRPFDLRFEDIFKGGYATNSFSQYGEDLVIHDYFKGSSGHFLDIGANDGVTFSNTWKLSMNGWSGTYVEGSPFVFERLKENCAGKDAQFLRCFLSGERADKTLYRNIVLHDDSIPPKRSDLLTTIDEECYLRTRDWGEFELMEVECHPFSDIEPDLRFETYRMISIDIEGLDYEVLSQIDLSKYGTEMVVAEYAGDEAVRRTISDYCASHGIGDVIFDNRVNIVLTKKKSI